MSAILAAHITSQEQGLTNADSHEFFNGGLTWSPVGQNRWIAHDNRMEYIIVRLSPNRWSGYILRDAVKVSDDYSCPSMHSVAEHLLGAGRRQALRIVAG
jgi:hypothetical protein